MNEKRTGYTNVNSLARRSGAMLLLLTGLLGISQPTSAQDSEFVNISTRAYVGTGAEVMIGGFIIRDGSQQVLIQALGPELTSRGVSNALADPVLRVVRISDGVELTFNDNWEDTQGQLVTDLWGGSPNLATGSSSSAAVLTLQPGLYTALVEGKNGTSGVAIVEVYGIDSEGADGQFANLSTRALVRTGDEVMIGGFIIRGGPKTVLVQAQGPELAAAGLSNVLADPVLTVIDSDGAELIVNDDWEDSQKQQITDLLGGNPSLAPGSLSSIAVITLEPGSYTAKVEGKDGDTGIAIVEVIGVDSAQPSFDAESGPGDQSYTVGTAIGALTLPEATGGNGTLTYSLSPSVPGLGFDPTTRRLTGTPTTPGAHSMTYTATDADGDSVSLTFTISVTEPDTQPGFAAGSGPGDLSYPIDTAIGTLTLPEASGGNGTLTYSLTPSVPGLTFNPTTRSLTGTPTTPGTYSLTYTVTDADGDSDSLTFRIYSADLGSADRAALTALYNATDGVNWTKSENWTTDLPLDQWFEVITDENNRVTAIDLSYNELSGPIPAELGNLANLQYLDLRNNNLSGPIPAELDNLANLETINLGGNHFSGCIPDGLKDVPEGDLSTLGLQYCESIASDRAALVALYNSSNGEYWINNANWLTDAPLGDWVGVTTDTTGRVVLLNLSSNKLNGLIPSELGNLASLQHLNLYSNNLTGPIPPELGNLANLTSLRLGNNRLTGPIPPELGNLANLTSLWLGDRLTGSIPPELGNLDNLTELMLFENRLTGPIPPELGNLASLQHLSLYRNNLTGPIPPELGNLDNLTELMLFENRLTGPIPPELGDLANLTTLYLNANHLTGSIPGNLQNLGRLDYFQIDENDGLCTPGTRSFVDWIEGLDLYWGQHCNDRDVTVLKSLYETASGGNWSNSDGWNSSAALAEWHGVTVDSLGRVVTLDLAGNGLSGRLPATLGSLTRLTELLIADNALSGRLPRSLADLSLRKLDYAETGLCYPPEESFRQLLNGTESHTGTGVQCSPISERDILVEIYDALGGPEWVNNHNWLTDAPLGDWHGVEVNDQGRVVALSLYRNQLHGAIPPVLGSLSDLVRLQLEGGGTKGPHPAGTGRPWQLGIPEPPVEPSQGYYSARIGQSLETATLGPRANTATWYDSAGNRSS